jgi:hypothetical protein
MAKTFDPSQLSPADQAAFAQWQQSLQQYVAQNGGGVPAPVTYALAKPEYVQSHPELKEGYDIVSGANLPPTVKAALQGYHPTWGKAGEPTSANMTKDKGLFGNWETWLQLGLAGAVGGVGAAGALGGAAGGGAGAASAGTGAAAVPALEGGATLAANLGGAGALGAGGAAAGAGAAASTASQFWDKVFGPTTADKIMSGLGMAGGLAGSLIQSNQADKATKAQQEAAAKALELQSNIYQQQRADLAPYRQAGASSLSALTYGLGLDPSKTADTTTPYFQQQFAAQQNQVPQNAQRNPGSPTTQPIPAGNYTGGQAVPRVSSLAATGQDGTVSMMSPDGRQARVPQNQVQAALAAGGRLA